MTTNNINWTKKNISILGVGLMAVLGIFAVGFGNNISAAIPELAEEGFRTSAENIPSAQVLNEQQENEILQLIQDDPQVKSILQKNNWELLHMVPAFEDDQTLATAVIKLSPAVWIEDDFYHPLAKENFSAKMWIGNLHVQVDVLENKILGIIPGMGKPIDAIQLPQFSQAEQIAKERAAKDLQKDQVTAHLGAIYYSQEYPDGVAFYIMDLGEVNEEMVVVSLKDNTIDESKTGIMRGMGQ